MGGGNKKHQLENKDDGMFYCFSSIVGSLVRICTNKVSIYSRKRRFAITS
jgi:hypothetical protein